MVAVVDGRPSVDALLAAQHARDAVLAHTAAPSLNTAEEAENTEAPTTRAAWLAAVLNQPQALGQVPAAWLDDAMVDAALQAHPAALAQVPAALQTLRGWRPCCAGVWTWRCRSRPTA